jgi:hypothetical protein
MVTPLKPRLHTGHELTTIPKAQDGGPLALHSSEAQPVDPQTLLGLPEEILQNILVEWANVEWVAPVIARRVCRQLKVITDVTSPAWSKLSVFGSATLKDIFKWLRRGNGVPKEIKIDTKDWVIVSGILLYGLRDVRSLIYQIPPAPYPWYKYTPLPGQLPEIRHLRIDGSRNQSLQLKAIFEFHKSHLNGCFPRLTVLHFLSIDLNRFGTTQWHAIFPNVRRLVLQNTGDGQTVLNLISACSATLEELRVIAHICHMGPSSDYDRISLPKLKVLVIERGLGTASHFDVPNLHVVYANLCNLDGFPGSFDSVVEWTTRWSTSYAPHTDITGRLKSMPRLRHLILAESREILKSCFELLRDDPSICPNLEWIEVADVTQRGGSISCPLRDLDTNMKEYLKACVAQRGTSTRGCTVEFVYEVSQEALFDEYYSIPVCFLTFSVISLIVSPEIFFQLRSSNGVV